MPTVEVPNSEDTQPTAAVETGHQLSGEVSRAATNRLELRRQGRHEEAILKFQEALELHGRPVSALGNALGGSHAVLRQHEVAIRHCTRDIGARDNPIGRVNRSKAYAVLGRCQEAIADARATRLMGPAMLGLPDPHRSPRGPGSLLLTRRRFSDADRPERLKGQMLTVQARQDSAASARISRMEHLL